MASYFGEPFHLKKRKDLLNLWLESDHAGKSMVGKVGYFEKHFLPLI